jgi:hypothetical protein
MALPRLNNQKQENMKHGYLTTDYSTLKFNAMKDRSNIYVAVALAFASATSYALISIFGLSL